MKEIFQRISVRKYTDQPVEDEKILQILRAGMAAPSAGNQQPWEFYVVKDPGIIQELSKCSKYAKCAAEASVVIVPCFRTYKLRFPEMNQIDLAIATENMLLEITSLGLGGVWLGVAPVSERMEFVDRVLGLDDSLHAFALIPVGYPDEDRLQQDRYDESRIHWLSSAPVHSANWRLTKK